MKRDFVDTDSTYKDCYTMKDQAKLFVFLILNILKLSHGVEDIEVKNKESSPLQQNADSNDKLAMDNNEKNLLSMMDDSLKNEIVLDALKSRLYDNAFDDDETKAEENEKGVKTSHVPPNHHVEKDEKNHHLYLNKDYEENNGQSFLGSEGESDNDVHHHGDSKRGIPPEIAHLINYNPQSVDDEAEQDDFEIDNELFEDEEFVEKKIQRIAKKDPLWWFGRRRSNRRRTFVKSISKVGKSIGKGFKKVGKHLKSWFRRIRLSKKDKISRRRDLLDKE